MAKTTIHCPSCDADDISKFGFSTTGKQRFRCNNIDCKRKTFLLNYTNKGFLPSIKNQIVEMALNGSGVRDTARVLNISVNTVINELKKIFWIREH